MKLPKFGKENAWIYGGIVAFIVYILLYLILQILINVVQNCWECLLLLSLLILQCNFFDITGYICILIGVIIYFLVGSLIALLISKIKGKTK